MNGAYGGLIIIINYASGQGADEQEFGILTESSEFILTEVSQIILTETP